jgi:hypothetical protein
MHTQAQRWGQQHALQMLGLLKQAAYDPWQVNVAKKHYPQFFQGGADEEAMQRLQESMRVRGAAPPSPTQARMLPATEPGPRLHWPMGGTEPINSAEAEFMRRMKGQGSTPLPEGTLPLTPANTPAEPPHTPPHKGGRLMRNPTLNVSESQISEMTGAKIPSAIRRAAQFVQRAR